jgi:hypothetical protein
MKIKNTILKYLTYIGAAITTLLALATITSAQSFGLGQISENATKGLAVVGYAVYILPPLVIGLIAYFLWSRKKHKQTTHLGFIYSVEQKAISDIKPFIISRKFDEVKNIENVRAIFVDDLKKKQSGGGIFGIFKNFFSGKKKLALEDEPGAIFNESLATFDESTKTWVAWWTLESNLLIPMLVPRSDENTKMAEMERTVEKRITHMKSIQYQIGHEDPAAALSSFGKIQILCVIVLFIAIIIIAWGVFSLNGTLAGLTKIISTIHIANATT